jgi:hypothetical protein
MFFTDEAWSTWMATYINCQNNRVWSAHNPHCLQRTAFHRQKVGVWVATSRKWIIGPILFYNSATSDRYCNDILYPFIGELNQNEINNVWFQQDGATARTTGQSIPLLSEIFCDRGLPDHLIWARQTIILGELRKSRSMKTTHIPLKNWKLQSQHTQDAKQVKN